MGIKSDEVYIKHIITEIKFIKIQILNLEYEDFLNDEVLKRAISRSIEIIGEASKNLSEDFKIGSIEIDNSKVSIENDLI